MVWAFAPGVQRKGGGGPVARVAAPSLALPSIASFAKMWAGEEK